MVGGRIASRSSNRRRGGSPFQAIGRNGNAIGALERRQQIKPPNARKGRDSDAPHTEGALRVARRSYPMLGDKLVRRCR
jgi:hypothetical protein